MAPKDINEQIIESLYAEALLLADEARSAFDMRSDERAQGIANPARVALSIEGLRTTTRIMHVLAWLLNQRAYLSGELSETQLRRYGALPKDTTSVNENLELLEPNTQLLVQDSERLHARVARLDGDWRAQSSVAGTAVVEMQGRIAAAFGGR